MTSTVGLFLGGVVATYIFLRFLLSAMLSATQDANEPPAILTGIPFIQPLAGMIREKSRFYIPALQKQWRVISFASIAADAGATVGGGRVLCPGRHFASTEILALAALLALQFDVVPAAATEGWWVEPTWEKSPVQAGFPVIDEDIQVELRPREPGRRWRVVYSGSERAMGVVEWLGVKMEGIVARG